MQDMMPRKPMTLPGKRSDGLRAFNEGINRTFAANVLELNERLKQAGMPLHYHSGFIQITQDEQLQQQVEQPFWLLVGALNGRTFALTWPRLLIVETRVAVTHPFTQPKH